MSTPILTPQQQKHTLSAKKKRKKPTIKNLLSSPYLNYWPVVNSNDSAVINAVLQQHLTIIKQEKIKIPWSVMKQIPREDRKNHRSKLMLKNAENREAVFGVNESCRLLENNGAGSILLSADVNPPLLIRHIIDIAVLKQIAVLLVPGLKDTLRNLTGIGSVAIGIKSDLNEESAYSKINKTINEIYISYPAPTNHINYDRPKFGVLSEDETITEDEMITEDEDTEEHVTNVYLYRASNKERIFKPQPSKLLDDSTLDESPAFIKFESDTLHNTQNKANKRKLSYNSMIIKRVKNNTDRNKKKIKLLKKEK